MLYTAAQIIADFRSDVFDAVVVDDAGIARDTLWSAADALRYLNQAIAQVATDTLQHRVRLSLPVVANEPLLYLPTELLEVIRVDLTTTDSEGAPIGSSRGLEWFNIDEGILRDDYGLRYVVPVDLETSTGTPRHITRDYDPAMLRLYPIPLEPGILYLYASAIPDELLSVSMPLPFSGRKERHLMLLWMKKLAYAKHDADTLDLRRSADYEAEYRVAAAERFNELDRDRREGGIMPSRW